MKYLITGGAGFIGSHLVEALLSRGHELRVLDDLSTGRLDNLDDSVNHDLLTIVQGSIEEHADVGDLVTWADTVFHLAAAVGVDLVVSHPVRTIETNVHGTESVLRLAEPSRTKVIVASTSEVYGRAESEVFNEADDLLIGPPTHSRWSYAASKALDEFLALSYFKEGRLPTFIVRFFNTVGPRQTGQYGMVVPRFVQSAILGEPIRVFGDGEQTRCFCHVKDTVRALIALDEKPEAIGEIFNIGSTESVSINELAALVVAVTGSESEITHIPYEQAYESGFEDMRRRRPDTTKIHALTGWQPEHGLEQIIGEVRDYELSRASD